MTGQPPGPPEYGPPSGGPGAPDSRADADGGGGGGGLGVGASILIALGIAAGVGLLLWPIFALTDCAASPQRSTSASCTVNVGTDGTDCAGSIFGDNPDCWGYEYPDTTGGDVDNIPRPGERWYHVEAEAIWSVRNVFDNQTDVDLQTVGLKIRGLHWTTPRDPSAAWITIYGGQRQRPLELVATYGSKEGGTATVRLKAGQAQYSEYLIVFPGCAPGGQSPFMDHVRCPEAPIKVFTDSAPQLLGVYRRDSTLFVVFSEDMDPETTHLGHEAIDLLFRDGDGLKSVVSDLNLAAFETRLTGRVFAIAPIYSPPFQLLVGPSVRGQGGGAMDVDRNGLPDVGQPLVYTVYPTLLAPCLSRADYPYPCISDDDAAVTEHSFDSPYNIQVPVP